MSSDTVFHKIVRGDIPSSKLYEDEQVLALLDIEPATDGHFLVIPKQYYKDLLDIDPDVLAHIVKIGKELAEGVAKTLGADGFNLHNNSGIYANQDVPYFHMHVIPRYKDDGMSFGGPVGESNTLDVEVIYKKLKNQ